jgi:hypothetical protein
MRKVLLALSVLLVASIQIARAEVHSDAAPADAYFGPYRQSVLEIRNRLSEYDTREDPAMLDPSVPIYLNHLQIAIVDWEHKYPRDPWLPGTFAHLIREYCRAGQASSADDLAALAVMRSAYPNAVETAASVLLVYGSKPSVAATAHDDAPPAAVATAPQTIPSYAQPDNSYGSDAVVPEDDAPPAR